MSGIGLLFDSAIDYERTHQIAIYTLLKQSQFGNFLQGRQAPWEVLWEPEGQLFDLGLRAASTSYIELKMWANLSDQQKKRQSAFLQQDDATGFYFLLGSSWFEITEQDVASFSGNRASKIGYVELIKLLNQVIVSADEKPDVLELALSYRMALEEQYQTIITAYNSESRDQQLFWYSLYHQIRSHSQAPNASIYTVNNPGGEVYILNDSESWLSAKVNGVAVDLCFEVVNGSLCIKFYAETEDKDVKRSIREVVRTAVHKVLDPNYTVIDAGRIGKYMTACQIEHDFSNTAAIVESATVFDDIHRQMRNIIKAV